MTGYAELYDALRNAGCSDEEAAALVDGAVCEDALARRWGRQPTEEEVAREYEELVA
ncbi:MAG: hypothetical protein GX657_01855 [Chloroflexi bacterium]|nr:hypothetical protein [Chloroflexota bacterium]